MKIIIIFLMCLSCSSEVVLSDQEKRDRDIAYQVSLQASEEDTICETYKAARQWSMLLKESANNYRLYGKSFNSANIPVSDVQRWFESNRENYLRYSEDYRLKYNKYFNLMECK